MSKEDKTQTTAAAMREPTPDQPLTGHRFIVSNTADPFRPIVVAVTIQATSREKAKAELAQLESRLLVDHVPGVSRSNLNYEEAAPFLRDGYGIRHERWDIPEVLYLHNTTYADVYFRNHDLPMQRPVWYKNWAPDSTEILQHNCWLVVGKSPPTNRNKA